MKKVLFTLIGVISSITFTFGQATLIVEAPLDNTTSTNRAPNGTAAHTYLRACALVLQSELTNIPSGTSITSFGFTLSVGVSSNYSGNFSLYLQNTTDATYQKGTNWHQPGGMF
jgi:hypothetical protein